MSVFKTFMMGGYECADHINRSGVRVNLLKETQHDIRVEEDYRMLAATGIRTVREGICWSAVETAPGVFDFSEVLNRMRAAAQYGMQPIWDLIHFGYPDGLYPTHPHFCSRFVQLCEAFALFYKAHVTTPLLVVPINEISFLSWHSGDVRGTVPFAVNSGWDIKYHLCKAAIVGIRALREIDPACTVLLVEPLVMIHPDDRDELFPPQNQDQYQAMDIILGTMCPELGGAPDLADILGFNYYWNCQWTVSHGPLSWPEAENRRIPLSALLSNAYLRYGKPMLLSETGHFGIGRVEWLEEVAQECRKAIAGGVDLLGLCIYPVTDRPDWDDLSSYCQCGMWDLDEQKERVPEPAYIDYVMTLTGLRRDTTLSRYVHLYGDPS